MPRHSPADRDPKELLPLKAIELLILVMLRAGDRHGYGIRRDILEHSDGRIVLEAGNLYRHLRGLEDDGILEQLGSRPTGDGDERRIYYTLTPFGRRVLAAETRRLRALLELRLPSRALGTRRA